MNAHNLGMVAMTARMQHERNYNDEQLARLTGMRRLDIDPTRVEMGWIIDFCAQALRNIVIGMGGRFDGYTMQSKFGIAVGSELMAILAVATDLADLKDRINKITVAFDKSGKPVTCGDLEVGNAMAAFMRNTINPTLMCTAEYQPCFVHAGPFANIAVGQSSIIADRVGLKCFDYHVTESGFAADIGFEKFWNVKCRFSGLKPHVSVLTSTIRALKMHGGGPKVVAGKALDEAYTKENLELVEKGCENMVHMIGVIRKAGINPVVCINRFYTDTDAECAIVRKAAEAAGARCAESKHWEKGGEGALEFADAVIDACEEGNDFDFLYPLEMKLRDRVGKNRHGSLRCRRCGLGSGSCRQGRDAGKRSQVRRFRHHDGQDPPVPVPRPGQKGRAQGMAAAHPRRAHLLRRQIPVPLRRDHQPDAGNRL